MDVWWHNRLQLPLGEREPPLAELESLEPLLVLALADSGERRPGP
jgi:hypothetical protein